jgi:hypothetical protein
MALAGPRELANLLGHIEQSLYFTEIRLSNLTDTTTHEDKYLRLSRGADVDASYIRDLKDIIEYLKTARDRVISAQQTSSPSGGDGGNGRMTMSDYYDIRGTVNTATNKGESIMEDFGRFSKPSYLLGRGALSGTEGSSYTLATVMGSRNAPNMTYGDYWTAGQNRAMRWTS